MKAFAITTRALFIHSSKPVKDLRVFVRHRRDQQKFAKNCWKMKLATIDENCCPKSLSQLNFSFLPSINTLKDDVVTFRDISYMKEGNPLFGRCDNNATYKTR
jgi:hypothetical protein